MNKIIVNCLTRWVNDKSLYVRMNKDKVMTILNNTIVEENNKLYGIVEKLMEDG